MEASDSTLDFLVQSDSQGIGELSISDGLVQLEEDRTAGILIQNPFGATQTIPQGTRLGDAFPVTVEIAGDSGPA